MDMDPSLQELLLQQFYSDPEDDRVAKSANDATRDEIKQLVISMKSGTDEQKEQAITALAGIAKKGNNGIIRKAGGIKQIVALVRSGTKMQQKYAAEALEYLACNNRRNRVAIHEAGGIEALVAIAESAFAAAALAKLAHDDTNKVAIASAGGIEPLVALTRSGRIKKDLYAAKALKNLACKNDANKDAIREAGGIEPLVALARWGTNEQKSVAAGALESLACKNDANKVVIREKGGIEPLVALARSGQMGKDKLYAAGALANLAANEGNQVSIASYGGIKPLVALVESGTDGQKEQAAAALANLAANDANKDAIREAYGIEPLVELARSEDTTEKQKLYAAEALANLAANYTNKDAIRKAYGIEPLVALVKWGTDGQKEQAAAALDNLICNNNANKVTIASTGGIDPLVRLVRLKKRGMDDATNALAKLADDNDRRLSIIYAGGIKPLVELARSGTEFQKLVAAQALGNVANGTKVIINAVNDIEPLVELARSGTNEQKSEAACALGNIAVNDANKDAIRDAGGIEPLVAIVRSGGERHKLHAAMALTNLAANNDANKDAIREAYGIEPLVELARSGGEMHKLYAVDALALLAANDANKVVIREAGGIKPLVALARSGPAEKYKLYAAEALKNLASNDTNKNAIRDAGGIEPLVALARSGDEGQKLHAAGALANLKVNNDTNREAIASAEAEAAEAYGYSFDDPVAEFIKMEYEKDGMDKINVDGMYKINAEMGEYFKEESETPPTGCEPATLPDTSPVPVAVIVKHTDLGLGCALFYPESGGSNEGDLVFSFSGFAEKTIKANKNSSIYIAASLKIINGWSLKKGKCGTLDRDIFERWAGLKEVAGCLLSKWKGDKPPIPLETTVPSFKAGRVYITTGLDVNSDFKRLLVKKDNATNAKYKFLQALNLFWACSTIYTLANRPNIGETMEALRYVFEDSYQSWRYMPHLVLYPALMKLLTDGQDMRNAAQLVEVLCDNEMLFSHDEASRLVGAMLILSAGSLGESPVERDNELKALAYRAYGRYVIAEMLDSDREKTIKLLSDNEATIFDTTATIAHCWIDNMIDFVSMATAGGGGAPTATAAGASTAAAGASTAGHYLLMDDQKLEETIKKIREYAPELLVDDDIGFDATNQVYQLLPEWMKLAVRASRANNTCTTIDARFRLTNRSGAYRRCSHTCMSGHVNVRTRTPQSARFYSTFEISGNLTRVAFAKRLLIWCTRTGS